MKIQIKSLLLGFFLGVLLPVAGICALLFLHVDNMAVFRLQTLVSGKTIKITSFHLAWGVEHEERKTDDDTFALEYVSSGADLSEQALDQETLEVFELIRPISEQWGFDHAIISAFPTTKRKGKYHIYKFTRDTGGSWKFERELSKVFVND